MADQKPDQNMIAGLLREREAYVRSDNTERVAQVDEQLKHYGYTGDDPGAEQATGMAATPQGRTATGDQQTAEGDTEAKPARRTGTRTTGK